MDRGRAHQARHLHCHGCTRSASSTCMLELTVSASEALQLHRSIGSRARGREYVVLEMVNASREKGVFVKFLTGMYEMLAGGSPPWDVGACGGR
eukprot:1075095-Amphidinium_carterae.3